jgi:enoyl-CoA hydratase/carnithine racemase
VGLWPMVIMSVICRNVGPKQALKLFMTGEAVDAAEALRIGLVTEVVPREQLDERVDALAASLATKSPVAMKLGRDAYHAHRDLPFDEQVAFLTGELARVAATEDAAEGILAFLQKRPPVYRGR